MFLFKKKIKIATHSGNFHSDDIFAVATVEIFCGEKNKFEIIRTRDQKMIDLANFVVDVGGVYNPKNNLFDHHQNGLEKREEGFPYAAFGLVWKEFGPKICGNQEISDIIESKLVKPVDLGDNGVDIFKLSFKNVIPYTINEVFDSFIPCWDEKNIQDQIFLDLVEFAKKIIKREIKIAKSNIEAGEKVQKIYSESEEKSFLVLDKRYPSDVFEYFPSVLFTISQNELDGNWWVKAIRKEKGALVNRKNFPDDWAGKTGQELIEITGVPDAIFCHKEKFLCVTKTKEGAIKLVKLAL